MPGVTVRDHAHQAPEPVVLPDEFVVEPVTVEPLAPPPPVEPPPDRATEETR